MSPPRSEVLAYMRRPYFQPHHFLLPRRIIDGTVAMPPPTRCYTPIEAKQLRQFCTPQDIASNDTPHNFAQLLPEITTMPGRMPFRDAVGDLFRHDSPCHRMSVMRAQEALGEMWGTQTWSPFELEFMWNVLKLHEAAHQMLQPVHRGGPPLPGSEVAKGYSEIDNSDWLSSTMGLSEEQLYKKLWQERGGHRIMLEVTPRTALEEDSYKGVRRMYAKRRFLAQVSREWTKWGLDMREGFFWAGPLAGQYVTRSWMRPVDRGIMQGNAYHMRAFSIPPL